MWIQGGFWWILGGFRQIQGGFRVDSVRFRVDTGGAPGWTQGEHQGGFRVDSGWVQDGFSSQGVCTCRRRPLPVRHLPGETRTQQESVFGVLGYPSVWVFRVP